MKSLPDHVKNDEAPDLLRARLQLAADCDHAGARAKRWYENCNKASMAQTRIFAKLTTGCAASFCVLALVAGAHAEDMADRMSYSNGGLPAPRERGASQDINYDLQFGRESSVFVRSTRLSERAGDRFFDTSGMRLSGMEPSAPCCAGPGTIWGDAQGSGNLFTIGYGWQRFRIEGSALAASRADDRGKQEQLKLDFRRGRLSFAPSQNLTFQLDRSFLGTMDQFEPNERIRRVSFLARYDRPLTHGRWEATFAWGRSTKNDQEPVLGYLIESTYRWEHSQAIFGRLEQVGSGELIQDRPLPQREWRKLNKLSIGYVRQAQLRSHVKMDVGALFSRYMVPSDMAPGYGSAPYAGMIFVRFNLD